MKNIPVIPQYRQKSLLRRRSIRLKDRRVTARQIQAVERGKAIAFYAKELAKKVADPRDAETGTLERH